MSFITLYFYVFVFFTVLIFYIVPQKIRWIVLLVGSIVFYISVSKWLVLCLLGTVTVTYGASFCIFKSKQLIRKKILLIIAIIGNLTPLIILKYGNYIYFNLFHKEVAMKILLPLGISFYTLQLIGYLIDIYRKEEEPESNYFRLLLFASFFPQILQGPIPRFKKLSKTLYQGKNFNEEVFCGGLQLILWGIFLKIVIADKAALFVNTVFDTFPNYQGVYVLLAGILFSIQLYADFSGCVCIARGIAFLFGIELDNNFNHPYFSKSIQEFWRRWHISLSSWLRDYIYIPLGGNRHGKLRKYLNIIITFAVSGVWHGVGVKFLLWGCIHGMYQMIGQLLVPFRNGVVKIFKIDRQSIGHKFVKQLFTLFLVMCAWIIFRADNLKIGIHMLKSMFKVKNVYVLFQDTKFSLGLDLKDFAVLMIAIGILLVVSILQRNYEIRKMIAKQHIFIRWSLYLITIFFVLIYGTYGFGYIESAFIYGGF